ncbi:MAG TPA: DUF2007 domain-containing protein [Urbifossiella sp.]
MSNKLVTIATFDQAAKARLAQNTLAEAGIRAIVADEGVVSMDWLLGGAVGWVKVQVMDEDSERAVDVLEGAFGRDGEADLLNPEEFAAEAEATPRENEPPDAAPPGPDASDVALTEREMHARRGFYAALFGIVMPPLLFYAVYLILIAAFSDDPMNTRGNRQIWAAGSITVLGLLGWWSWVSYAPTDFLFVM